MPEIFIDDKRYEYEESGKVLQFLLDNGLDLPFFCYHEKLSIPANCRQCLVEAGSPVFNRETNSFDLDDNGERVIRWFPKLMTACSMDMSDGMVIKTHVTSEKVRRAQKDNLEFILINHPLDCPICDQAGECPLQIQTYKYGPEGSRFEFKKVHKPKRIVLGPRVVLDAERCINCTRCVRFCQEISKTDQLTIVSRGDKNYPITAPGKEFDDPYSLNTVDLCPVGALTASDFRFKARVWEMNQTPSIDITNGKGCNIDIWTRDNLVLRITPRYNPNVNDYWMPDSGRAAFQIFNENRISKPEIIIEETEKIKSSWNNALATFLEIIESTSPKDIAVVGSGNACVEDLYAYNSFFESLGCSTAIYNPHSIDGFGDGFLLVDDQSPNINGARLLGLREKSETELKSIVSDPSTKVIVVLQDDLIGRGVISEEDVKGKTLIVFDTNHNETTKAAQLTVPITCIAEHAGSYINTDGRIQRSLPAKETVYTNRQIDPEMVSGRLDRYGTKFDNWRSDKNRVDCIPAWEFINRLKENLNHSIKWTTSREIMDVLSSEHPAFAGVSFVRMDDENGISLSDKLELEAKLA